MKKSIFVKGLILLAAVAVFGCSKQENQTTDGTNNEIQGEAAAQTTATEVPATPIPTEVVVPMSTADPVPVEKEFHELDEELLKYISSESQYAYFVNGLEDETLAASVAQDSPGFGIISSAFLQKRISEAKTLLEKMNHLDRDVLSLENQLLLDNYEQYLEKIVAFENCTDEWNPLDTADTYCISIPQILENYPLETAEDAEQYLTLLADTQRYFDNLLTYEKNLASMNTFISSGKLEQLTKEIEAAKSYSKSHVLESRFKNTVKELKGVASAERKEMIARNKDLVYNTYLPALESFLEGMNSLADSCREDVGAINDSKELLEYYSARVAEYSQTQMRPDEVLKVLESAMDNLYLSMKSLYEKDATIDQSELALNKLQEKKIAAKFKDITAKILDERIETAVVTEEVSTAYEELAPYVSLGTIGEKKIQIIVNEAEKDENASMKVALCSYPGLAYLSSKITTEPGTSESAICYSSYTKGLAGYLVESVMTKQTTIPMDQAMYSFSRMMISDYILPAVISIYVNYYGYDLKQVQAYMTRFELGGFAQNGELYYSDAISSPYNNLDMAVGYALISELFRDCSSVLGENYDESAILEQVINYGPGYIGIIYERILELISVQ